MPQQIIIRNDTAARWTQFNPTLALGEYALETDTGKKKVGNGSLAWNSLPYEVGGEGGTNDHSLLLNRDQDGHTQYHTDARGDLRYVGLSDARLTDSRTPTAHAASHATAGSDAITPSAIGAATASQGALADTAIQPAALAGYVATGDSRLSDTRTPTAHAASHAAAGADAITPSAIGAATASQGALADTAVQPAALSSYVTTSDSRLSDARTPTSHNHTVGNITDFPMIPTLPAQASEAELLAGTQTAPRLNSPADLKTAITAHAPSGSGGAGTRTIATFTWAESQPPATAFATLDTRNSIAVLDFDDTTTESTTFVGIIPEGADLTSGILCRIHWAATTATSGDVRWGVQFEHLNTDTDADSYDTAALATTTTDATSGKKTITEISCTTLDSLAAGDLFRLRVYRNSADTATDTMVGDAELIGVELRGVA